MVAQPPIPMLRGPRLYLRPAERDDVPLFVRWLTDARVVETLNPRAPMSLGAEERWFDSVVERQGKDLYHFVICMRSDDRAIGTIGLHGLDLVNGSAEVGIAIGEPELWDQGLGSEALGILLDFGFGELRLERIALHVFSSNPRARRAYQKLGFVHEGTERHGTFRHGRWLDVDVMSVLRDEWSGTERTHSWELP